MPAKKETKDRDTFVCKRSMGCKPRSSKPKAEEPANPPKHDEISNTEAKAPVTRHIVSTLLYTTNLTLFSIVTTIYSFTCDFFLQVKQDIITISTIIPCGFRLGVNGIQRDFIDSLALREAVRLGIFEGLYRGYTGVKSDVHTLGSFLGLVAYIIFRPFKFILNLLVSLLQMLILDVGWVLIETWKGCVFAGVCLLYLLSVVVPVSLVMVAGGVLLTFVGWLVVKMLMELGILEFENGVKWN
jgi:hypothetical protein